MQLRHGLWPTPTLPITSIIFRMSTQNLQTDWYLKYYHDAQKLPMQGWMMMINNNNSNSNNNNDNNNDNNNNNNNNNKRDQYGIWRRVVRTRKGVVLETATVSDSKRK